MDNTNFYDVIIVGAGPAGLAVAHELLEQGIPGHKILILEMGPDLPERINDRDRGENSYNVSGLGGAGLFSDGKITVPNNETLETNDKFREVTPHSEIKGDALSAIYTAAYKLLTQHLDDVPQYQRPDQSTIDKMQSSFSMEGVDFRFRQVIQVPPHDLVTLVHNFSSHLIKKNVTIKFLTRLSEIHFNEETQIKFLSCIESNSPVNYSCRFLILSIGKSGMPWLVDQCNKNLHLDHSNRPIEVGVRVEVPKSVLEPFTNIHKDLKLVRAIDDSTVVKTFCTCVGGMLATCYYDDMVMLGGYTGDKETSNTNFALLTKIELDGVDSLEYGRSLIRIANIVGKNKPILQLLGDLRSGSKSSHDGIVSNSIQTTLDDFTLADLNLVYPKNVINQLVSTLNILGKIIKGIDDETNIISAPCLERCYPKFHVNQWMETNLPDIFMAGDVAGNINGLLSSVASGIIAAQGVAKKWSIYL